MSLLRRPCAASFITSLLIAAAVGLFVAPSSALAAASSGSPGVYVPAATLVTMDGAVVYSKNPDKSRRIASCTKMLTALVVRDKVSLDTVIRVSSKAAEVDDGAIGLKTGQKYTVRQLLGVMLVHSANGAAEALATAIGGNEKKFVAMMYAKARSLGLKRPHPADPHGLSPHGYSTAADQSVIARHLMNDPVLRAIVSERTARLPRGAFSTTNRLLGSYSGIEGVKTGYTDPAGYCFVGAAKRNGVELIGVVLGASSGGDRFTQMRRLLDWGFAHSEQQRLVSKDQTMGVVAVSNGAEPTVTVHAAKVIALTVFDGCRQTTQVSLPPSVSAPIKAGQRLGAVQISRNGTVVASVPLVADQSVGALSAMQLFQGAGSGAQPAGGKSLWSQIAAVMSGFGRLLGI